MTVDDDRSATLILRVWLESGSHAFRSRLTTVDTTLGPEGGELTVGATSSPNDLVAAVHAWLEEFLSQAPHRIDDLH